MNILADGKAKDALGKTLNGFKKALPSFIGVFLLVGLVLSLDISVISNFFTGNPLIDALIGSSVGSVAAGNPITSYIIAGELLNKGVSLLAVTAFLLAWVTVGIVQFPAEAILLGKKFAIVRNASSFALSVLVAFAVITILKFI